MSQMEEHRPAQDWQQHHTQPVLHPNASGVSNAGMDAVVWLFPMAKARHPAALPTQQAGHIESEELLLLEQQQEDEIEHVVQPVLVLWFIISGATLALVFISGSIPLQLMAGCAACLGLIWPIWVAASVCGCVRQGSKGHAGLWRGAHVASCCALALDALAMLYIGTQDLLLIVRCPASSHLEACDLLTLWLSFLSIVLAVHAVTSVHVSAKAQHLLVRLEELSWDRNAIWRRHLV